MWLPPEERLGWLQARLEEWVLAPEAFPLPLHDITWALDGSQDPCAQLVRELLAERVPLTRALVLPEPCFVAWYLSECPAAMASLLALWIARAPSSLTKTALRALYQIGRFDRKATPDRIRELLLVPPSLEDFLAYPLRTKPPVSGFQARWPARGLDNRVTIP